MSSAALAASPGFFAAQNFANAASIPLACCCPAPAAISSPTTTASHGFTPSVYLARLAQSLVHRRPFVLERGPQGDDAFEQLVDPLVNPDQAKLHLSRPPVQTLDAFEDLCP